MKEQLTNILQKYKSEGYSEELAKEFRETSCELIKLCSDCPMDKMVGNVIPCDHLIHGDRVTNWS